MFILLERSMRLRFTSVSRINLVPFMFQFSNENGCEQLLRDGLFTFDNHPLIMKKWHSMMCMDVSVICLILSISGFILGAFGIVKC